MELSNQGIKKLILYIILLLGAITMVFPFLWMISTSLKSEVTAYVFPPSLFPYPIYWQNYIEIWRLAPFGRFYFNSIIVAIATTLGQLITCSFGAYAFSKCKFPGRDVLFLGYIATMMVPFSVTMIPLFILIKGLEWIDKYEALIIPFLFSPYGTFLLRQFFMSIPEELTDAIKIDGGGHWINFLYVVIPLSKPALVTLGIFVFMFSWNNFLWPLVVINSTLMKTLPVGIMFFQGQYAVYWTYIMAATAVTIIPLLILFLLAQRYFIEGITLTGLKG